MKKTILLLLTVMFLFSCESKLTNQQVEKIIINKYDFSSCDNAIYEDRITANFKNGRPLNELDSHKFLNFKKLESEGYVNITEGKNKLDETYYKINLTDEGEKYGSFDYSINITFEKFGELIEVSQERDKATVLFTIKNEKTPFSKLFDKSGCPENTRQKEVKLIRIDNDWKLSKE